MESSGNSDQNIDIWNINEVTATVLEYSLLGCVEKSPTLHKTNQIEARCIFERAIMEGEVDIFHRNIIIKLQPFVRFQFNAHNTPI
ncbi:hypothetical protein HNY73_019818 [Argiope bruennichi]|uniref:Uncharacterized protein n=1 Tax=Argiope bruennichi TaxID=94029 RepID=A0A8T0E618_ARGBR|nr:hypothetical protein HNY73_019818 [Argiope bruennichi]